MDEGLNEALRTLRLLHVEVEASVLGSHDTPCLQCEPVNAVPDKWTEIRASHRLDAEHRETCTGCLVLDGCIDTASANRQFAEHVLGLANDLMHSMFLAEAWAKEHGLSTDIFDLAYEMAREPMAYVSSAAECERERHALFLHLGPDTRMH